MPRETVNLNILSRGDHFLRRAVVGLQNRSDHSYEGLSVWLDDAERVDGVQAGVGHVEQVAALRHPPDLLPK